MIRIEVIGTPQPEPRPRAVAMDTKPKPTARVYVPKTAHEWKHTIRRATLDALRDPVERLLGLTPTGVIPHPRPQAFAVAFEFRMPRPRNHWRTGRNAGKLKPWAVVMRHVSVPDLDNLIKAAQDAVGDWDGHPALVWCDDSQVCEYRDTPIKRYVWPGEKPGMTMVIYPLDPIVINSEAE